MTIVLTRATKQAARYTDAGGRERCSGCRFFMPQGTCGRIIGPVSPRGWCKYFSQEAVQKWQPGVIPAVGGPSLALDLMSPGTLPSGVVFARASTATYFDATGTMQTVATNAPRWDYDPVTHVLRGLLIEEQRTNVLLNTATLGTQSVAVTAQPYMLSFYGTGTITLSGAFAGSLVGTGAFPARVALPFTPAAGTLTCTVTGSVLNAQLEAGAFSTSYIPTIAAAVTRAYDYCVIPAGNMGFYAPPGGSWMAEFINIDPVYTGKAGRIVGQAAASGVAPLYLPSSLLLSQYDGGVLATANSVTPNVITKGASTWAPGAGTICLNGGSVASGALSGGYSQLSGGVAFLASGAGTVTESVSGYLRRVRYWPRVLSNAEMQQVTT